LYQESRFDEAFTYLEPVPIGLDNELFRDLLPVLLKKKSEKVIGELTDQAQISRINGRITSKQAIVEMYRESKNMQLSFEDYLHTL
jgi:hypothetical protein